MPRRLPKAQRRLQFSRKCIFCAVNNANSGEHLFPMWMHGLLPLGPEGSYIGERIDEHPKTRVITDYAKVTKPGEMYTRKLKVVCASCNNGWMSRIEERALPVLSKIVSGDPVNADAEQLSAVACWATLKAIVSEHGDRDTAVTPQIERTAFMRDGVIPSYFRIYLLNHSSPSRIGYLRTSQTISRSLDGPDPPLDGLKKNTQQISVVLGNVMLLINAARVTDFQIEDGLDMPAVVERRIWPPNKIPLSYPAKPILTGRQMHELGYAMEKIMAQDNVRWGGDWFAD